MDDFLTVPVLGCDPNQHFNVVVVDLFVFGLVGSDGVDEGHGVEGDEADRKGVRDVVVVEGEAFPF